MSSSFMKSTGNLKSLTLLLNLDFSRGNYVLGIMFVLENLSMV